MILNRVFPCAVILALFGCATASPPVPTPPIEGIILESGAPAAGVLVQFTFSASKTCSDAEAKAVSAEDGSFSIPRGAAGQIPDSLLIGPVWTTCFASPSGKKRSMQHMWVGSPRFNYASMNCDLDSTDSRFCRVAWLDKKVTEDPSEDVIREGTLCDARLVNDAKAGVIEAAIALGCQAPERFSPYIREMPTGTPGSRSWRETWVVFGCGNQYPIKLLFQENLTGVKWTIEDKIPVDNLKK